MIVFGRTRRGSTNAFSLALADIVDIYSLELAALFHHIILLNLMFL